MHSLPDLDRHRALVRQELYGKLDAHSREEPIERGWEYRLLQQAWDQVNRAEDRSLGGSIWRNR